MLPVRELIYKDKEHESFISLFTELKQDGIKSKEEIVKLLMSLGFPEDMSNFIYMKYKNFVI